MSAVQKKVETQFLVSLDNGYVFRGVSDFVPERSMQGLPSYSALLSVFTTGPRSVVVNASHLLIRGNL